MSPMYDLYHQTFAALVDPGSTLFPTHTGTIYFTDSQIIPVTPNYAATPRGKLPFFDTFRSFMLGLYSVGARLKACGGLGLYSVSTGLVT